VLNLERCRKHVHDKGREEGRAVASENRLSFQQLAKLIRTADPWSLQGGGMEEVLDDSLLPSFINKTNQCVHRKFLGDWAHYYFLEGGDYFFSKAFNLVSIFCWKLSICLFDCCNS
jgi:hypothetical protein